jgi:putative phage-type endonuclease
VTTAERTTWLEQRRLGIGGSEIAAIFGASPFSGPLDVYLSKVEGLDVADSPDMQRGRHLEAGIASWACEREGWAMFEPGALVHPESPILRCTPDRVVALNAEPYTQYVLSIKSPRRPGGEYGAENTDEIPVYAMLQLQWEMGIMRALHEKGVAAPLAGGKLAALLWGDLVIYDVAEDREVFAQLRTHAESWWQKHVVARCPPPIDGGETSRLWLQRKYSEVRAPPREATWRETELLLALKDAEEVSGSAEKTLDLQKNLIREAIGDSEGLDAPGIGRAMWRLSEKTKRRTLRTNWEAGHE